MISLNDATLTAVYAALQAGVTLATVYSVAPEGTQPPVVIIGELGPELGGGKGDASLARYEVRVVTVVAGASRKPLYALMAEVEAAMTGLSYAGALFSQPVLLSMDDRLNDEGNAVVGDQRFLVFAQPDA